MPKRKRGRRLNFSPGEGISARDIMEASCSSTRRENEDVEDSFDLPELEMERAIVEGKTQDMEIPIVEGGEQEMAIEEENVDMQEIVGKYVVAEFRPEHQKSYHYVGQVTERIGDHELLVNFFRVSDSLLKCAVEMKGFKEPRNKDESEVNDNKIVKV